MVEEWQWHDIGRLVWHVWHVKMLLVFGSRSWSLDTYCSLFRTFSWEATVREYKGSFIISIDDVKWKYVKSAELPTHSARWTACCDASKKIAIQITKKGLPPNCYSTASLQTKERDIKVIDKWTGVLWERLLWWFGWWQKWPRRKDQRAHERPAHDRHSRSLLSIFHISIKVMMCKLTSIVGENQWLHHPTCHSL